MKIIFSFVAFSILACQPATAADPVAELIVTGDGYAHVYDEENALKYYQEAEKLDPGNARILVAISREYRHLMSDAKSVAEKQAYLAEALKYALKAAEVAPSDCEAQLAPAITYGKLVLLEEDTGEQLELSRNIKIYADKALSLNADNDTAWHVLGCWHRGFAKVGGMKRFLGGLVLGDIPKTTYENAVACFAKAIEINPDRLMHRVELGRTYALMEKNGEAKEQIAYGLKLAETEKDDPETKRNGQATLQELH